MHKENFYKSFLFVSTSMAIVMTPGCALINEDLEPCPHELRLKFECPYLKETDAFRYEVNSINVWAFNKQGIPVWSGSASGQELKAEDFVLKTPLDEGTYDFVVWGGLEGNESFDLATYIPDSKEDLVVKMHTLEEDGNHISKAHLQSLFHGLIENVEFKANPLKTNIQTVTISLMKDTKDIRVMLQHSDGTEIDNRDFSVTITDSNGEYAWNNELLAFPTITYQPWNTKYSVVDSNAESASTREINTVASLLFELSTGRLMVDSNALLIVHRNWDNTDIIKISLIDYLLLISGNYGNLTDQQYLDCQDEYTLTFFLDSASNWYVAGGININGWTVVPPQSTDF